MTGNPSLTLRLAKALDRRRPLVDAADTNCYRLLTGSKEGVAGLVAERYGEVVVLQQFDGVEDAVLRQAARFYVDRLGVRAVYLKQFVRDRGGVSDEIGAQMRSPQPFFGEPLPEEIVGLEHGRRFALRPYDGFSVGLFLDQRENRARTVEAAAEKDVLNLFAYTCSFSVAAALGGAASTTSVDISPRALDWGRRNFALNEIAIGKHLFFKSDAADFLKRAKRQGRLFDLIILDPPSHAHGRRGSRSFSIQRDFAGMLARAVAVLRPRGHLLLCSNHRPTSLQDLEAQLRAATDRKVIATSAPGLPLDFAPDPLHSKSLWARLD